MAASVQTRDLRDLEVRLRHLFQYVSSHPHLGLSYPYPTSNYRSLETFTDASFASSGSHSHQGFAVLFKVGHSQHLLHWNSTRQKLVSQSSAEAELIALMTGFKATKSFQHLLSESVADLTRILRCDNQAVLAMLEKPSWRTRHISIRGEALRQAKDEKEILITYVSTHNLEPGGRSTDETHVATTEQRFLPQVGAGYPGRLFRRSRRQWATETLDGLQGEEEQVRLLQSVRARHSVPPMAQGITPKELPSFYPILFKSVSICFKMFHLCCLALPARVNVVNSIYKIGIVPFTTLPMTNNLLSQAVLGGTLKSVRLPKIPLCDSAVSFRPGQTRAHTNCLEWLVETTCYLWRADAYPITIISSTHYCFTLHTTVSYHHHIIIIHDYIATTRLFLDVGRRPSFLPLCVHLFLA